MKNKKVKTSKIIDTYEMANALSAYAKDLKKSSGAIEQLATTLIYAGLAEFFCEEFINELYKSINIKSEKNKVRINPAFLTQTKNTNLESALKKLKLLNYPDKKEIEETIELIKNSRNRVFHNIVRAGEKGLHLNTEMMIVHDYTPQLRTMITKSLLKLLGSN